MISDIIEDLRTLAQKCTGLARVYRGCTGPRSLEASHALEELGLDLTTKALELERTFDR